jgi:CheY-like chemotaxis protein
MNKHLILYVEDDELSREIMVLVVEDLDDYEIVMFPDSSDFEARVAALPRTPSIVLLDIHVQPYSGFEMLEMLRANPDFAQTPILALTASVMNEEVARLRRSGFSGAIAKPIDQDHFGTFMEQVLNGQRIWSIINPTE